MGTVAVTNNNLICETMSDIGVFSEIVYGSNTFLDVLIAAKNRIKDGFVLLNHPFFCGVMPHETAFKTLILIEGGETIDFNSLKIINSAIQQTKKSLVNKSQCAWSKNDLLEFRKIDLVLTERWINNVYCNMIY